MAYLYLVRRVKAFFERVWRFIIASELRIAFTALIFVSIAVGVIARHRYSDPEFRDGILIEAHGMLLDILVIGIFIVWLTLIRDRSERIRRYEEEIDDYREWNSDEASHRIAGIIKRLNAAGIKRIALSRCYLRKADLRGVDLSGSPMHRVDLGESRLRNARLDNVDLDTAFLGRCDLRNTSFVGANLTRARFFLAVARGAKFRNACFVRADLKSTSFRGADLRGCDFAESSMRGIDLAGADLRGARNLDVAELVKAKSLGYARLDDAVDKMVRAAYPSLIAHYKPPDCGPAAESIVKNQLT